MNYLFFFQEPTHFDADAALIQEDMEVMSDFELHRLCQQFSSISSYQLDIGLVLDSGKFHHLTKLLATLKSKVGRCLWISSCGDFNHTHGLCVKR